MFPRNAASPEPIAIGPVVQISDGAVQASGCTVRIKPIGVAESDGGGTTAYSTDGIVLYTPLQAETNYTSFILIAKKTGCIPASITIVTTATSVPGTVNVGSVNSVSTSSVTAVNANIGTTQPTNFTGTGASAYVKSDMTMISTDATAADNAEAFFDGTGYAGTGNVIPTVTNTGTLNGAATVVLTDDSLTSAKIATDAIDAASIKSDAVDKIQVGLATSAAVTSVLTRLLGLVQSNGAIGTGNTTTSIVLPAVTGSANDDLNNWGLLLYDNSATRYYYTLIRDWTASTTAATVDTLPFTPEDSTDLYWLLPVPSGVNVTRVGGTDQSAGTNLTDLASGTSGFAAIKTAVNNVQSTATQIHASTVATTGEVADASATTTVFKTNLVAVDDFYNDATITFTSGPLDGQTKPILDFAATNGQITLDEPLTSAPGNSIQFQINVSHVHPVSQIQAGMATQTSVDDLPTNAELATALGTSDDAVLAQVAIANAKLDVIDDFLDTEVAAILAAVDTEVAAIKAKTDNLPASPAAVGSQMDLVNAPSATALDAVVLAVLKRDWTGITGESARSVLNALRHIRNKWSVSGSTLTVTKEDDTTAAWTSTLTTDAAADPITGSDPA